MSDTWYVYADPARRDEVSDTLLDEHPAAHLLFEKSARDLRARLMSEPGIHGAVVGPSGADVSSVNIAAALAKDGAAREVLLVCDKASGSLRSRAMRAGIGSVIELSHRRIEAPDEMPLIRRVEAAKEEASAAFLAKLRSAPPASASEHDDLDEPELAQGKHVSHSNPKTETRSGAPVLCVGSGRGGVGKTMLVAAMARAAASWGMRVALLDFDLSLGNLHSCFGLPASPDLARLTGERNGNAIAREEIASLVVHVEDGIDLWGPCELPEMAETLGGACAELISHLGQSYDLVLVDTSTTCTDAVAQAFQSCDRLLLVTDGRYPAPGPISRMAALAVRLGVPRTRIVRVMNRSDDYVKKDDMSFYQAKGLEAARSFYLPDEDEDPAELLAEGAIASLGERLPELAKAVSFLTASVLSELGRLPEGEAAQKALGVNTRRRRRGWFGRMREAS